MIVTTVLADLPSIPFSSFKGIVTSLHPYRVTKIAWLDRDCATKRAGLPSLADALSKNNARWRVVVSSDLNVNYLAFLPSVVAHWRAHGLDPHIVLVAPSDSPAADTTMPLLEQLAAEVTLLRLPEELPNLPAGHVGKLARAYAATQLPAEDVVTIVDLDYYLFAFEAFEYHLRCVPENGVLGVGHNRYEGTPDEGKFPMYLTTARAGTLASILNPDGLAIQPWLSSLRGLSVFDAKESPFSKQYGTFSDESLFRVLISRYAQQQPDRDPHVVWVRVPQHWQRLDRASKAPLTETDIATATDAFPSPLSSCQTYVSRLLPIHRQLGIADPARDASFLRKLRQAGLEAREWGHIASQPIAESDIACIQLQVRIRVRMG